MMYTSGWPKNQNRCCHSSGDPPATGSKMWVSNSRSASSMISAPLSTGNASSTMKLVRNRFHVRIGMRNMVIPGARIIVTVVITLTAVSVPDVPVRMIDTIHRSAPSPGRPDRPRQRRIGEPAEAGGTAVGGEAEQHHQAADQVQPVRERVEPGERQVGRADLQRHEVVGEGEAERHGEQVHHDAAVDREDAVVGRLVDDLQPGLGEFEADDRGEQPRRRRGRTSTSLRRRRRAPCDRWWSASRPVSAAARRGRLARGATTKSSTDTSSNARRRGPRSSRVFLRGVFSSPGGELVGRHDAHREAHLVVIEPAELGAHAGLRERCRCARRRRPGTRWARRGTCRACSGSPGSRRSG